MQTEQWNRAQAIFDDVITLPTDRQREAVRNSCLGDGLIARAVFELLEEDRRQQPLLDSPLSDLAEAALRQNNADALIKKQIGPYRLLSVLGEGGMGVVYLAERTDIGGQVALKLLRNAWMSPMRRQRFALEQKTLAALSHPNIARIYHASNLPDGTPWFSMEYADGPSITAWMAEHGIAFRQRLLLFRQVCEAVQYAHGHAIVHRDLKPSNILVTSLGQVKLVDFGIAKHLAEQVGSERTIDGLRLMTPAYAAPEQLQGGNIGVFTDVYALGVLLHELLTGKLPAARKNQLKEHPTRKPSEMSASRGGSLGPSRQEWADLDVLCLTAMQEEPERRYRSLDALLRDLDAFLEGRVLQARPDAFWYRAGKFARRNRAILLSAATALAVLIAAIIVFTIRLEHARDAALQEVARTNRIQRFTESLFDGGDPSVGPAQDVTAEALLDRGQTEAASLRDDPRMQADMIETLGEAYQHMGRLARADVLLQAALRQRRDSFGPNDQQYAESLVKMGLLRKDQGRMSEAEDLLRQATALDRRNLRPSDPALARDLDALAMVLTLRGQYAESKKLLEEALQQELASGQQTMQLADTKSQIADVSFYLDNYQVSEALNREALAAYRKLFGNDHPSVAHVLNNLGNIAQNEGRFTQAENYFRQGLMIDEKWYGPNHPEVAADLMSAARCSSRIGNLIRRKPF